MILRGYGAGGGESSGTHLHKFKWRGMKSFHEMIDLMKPGDEGDSEPKHYMFFQNLKSIGRMAEAILAMDPREVDAMLSDGHDWAADHISTSKDDVEEVFNWLSGGAGHEDLP